MSIGKKIRLMAIGFSLFSGAYWSIVAGWWYNFDHLLALDFSEWAIGRALPGLLYVLICWIVFRWLGNQMARTPKSGEGG